MSNTTIPIIYHKIIPKTIFQTEIEPFQVVKAKIPVNYFSGEIYIPKTTLNNCYIPETLTVANKGSALIEIHNPTVETQEIKINEPINVAEFGGKQKENYFLFSLEINNNNPCSITKTELQNLIRTDHLNIEERSAITKLCSEFSDILYQENEKLTFTNQVKHEIRTTDEIPVHTKSYRYPFIHKPEVEKQITKMLQDGIIRPSSSPWSSPIWIVPKKADASGKTKWRIVVDYRKVNEKTIDDRYPLPNITDILDKIGKCQYFSVIDLVSGFHQIEMHPRDIEKTAFNVENGHYEYVRMPFGLKNAPSTFQRVMDNILKGLQNKICFVYMDDIVIFSTSLQEHIDNLKLVFERLREANFKIQLDKCEFLRKEVKFLGHVITSEGIKPNQKKIEAIQKFPIPKTPKEIKSFLGLLGYYRRFIKDFAKITKPFTQCLKKGEKIVHDQKFIETFNMCKNILTNDPILQYPDFTKPFNLTTDASNFALGAVLSQGPIGKDLPIAYASRTLNPAECNYSTIEKELLGIVWATKYFRPYLFGRRFTIITDHMPLRWLFSLKDPNSRLVRWRLKLEEYDYEIVYKKGKLNTNADALSRIQLNTLETESVIAEVGDLEEDILNLLNDTQSNITIENDELDEYLRELDNIVDNSCKETVHSALEHPVLTLPITDQTVNNFNFQIILKNNSDISELKVRIIKLFEQKTRIIATIGQNVVKDVIRLFKEYVDPKKHYCIFLENENMINQLCNILANTFKNTAYKLTQSTKFVKDIEDIETQRQLITFNHELKTCHRGINDTLNALKQKYYWPKMQENVTYHINTCDTCQTAKYDRNPPRIKFQLTPTCSKPFEVIHIDIFQYSGKKFLTIIDSFSKYLQAYYLQNSNSISVLNSILKYVSHHGIPQTITCDNGTEFNTSYLKDFAKLHGIILHFTTRGNSNSNSPIERAHSTLAENLRCLQIEDKTSDIPHLMFYAILGYNNSLHSSTKHRPYEVINGHTDSKDIFDITDENILNTYINSHKNKVSTLYNTIKEHNEIIKSNIIEKRNADRENPVEYPINNPAYVRTNIRSKSKPRYKKETVTANQDIKIQTNTGFHHKSKLKKPRKLRQSSLLQDDDTNPSPGFNPQPGPSSRN